MNKDAINRMLLAYYFPSVIVPRGQGNEAKRVNTRLNGFDHTNSEVYKCLKQKFGATVTHSELRSIAKIICLHTGLTLDRDATRDCRVLIKWFDENWKIIYPNLDNITLRDEKENVIDEQRDLK